MTDDSARDIARLEALELVDRLLREAMFEHRYGRLEVVIQDGLVTIVREERIHKIGQRPAAKSAA